ncbi:MAG: ComF family protein [Patescibacteria group bacterium]|nr:ComF family protein [Patescibacteria group bacterium]
MCQRPSPLGLTHPGCLTPHAADGLVSILNYRDQRVADVIIAGKYHSLPGAFEELGKFAADKIPQLMPQLKLAGAVLVPLPLHPRRLRWRGFNQAAILCESIGPKLDLPAMAALIRVKPTKTQKDLDKERRVKNIAGAFAINPSLKPLIANKDAILVDDVVTTGSTLQEAAKVLKRNGAKRVFCLTIAKD